MHVDLLLSTVDNDLSLAPNNALALTTTETLQQRLQLRLTVLRGDWLLDEQVGVRWLDVLGNARDDQQISSVITDALLQDPDVVSVNVQTISQVPGTRKIDVAVLVTSTQGETSEITATVP